MLAFMHYDIYLLFAKTGNVRAHGSILTSVPYFKGLKLAILLIN